MPCTGWEVQRCQGQGWGGSSGVMLHPSVSPPQACENGRGAILLSVARGKVSEGIDFGE